MHAFLKLTDNNAPEWYNKSENYLEAVREALEAKQDVLRLLTHPESWAPEGGEGGGGSVAADATPKKQSKPALTLTPLLKEPSSAGDKPLLVGDKPLLMTTGTSALTVEVGSELEAQQRPRAQLACATLAATEGNSEFAELMLRLAVLGSRTPVESASDIQEALQSDFVRGKAPTPRESHEHTSHPDERWRLEAARLLLGKGCMDPWPSTFVLVASGGGRATARACAFMASQLLTVATRAVGELVLVHDQVSKLWRRGTITSVTSSGSSPRSEVKFSVRVGMRNLEADSSSVLVPSAGGISAIMREAAKAGRNILVEALLELGVGIFESDLAATTALHAAAGAGQPSVCKLLTAAGADPYLENARQLSAYEEAVHSRSNLCRRLFRQEESDTDVQEAHDTMGSSAQQEGRTREAGAGGEAAALLLVTLDHSGGSLWDNSEPSEDTEAKELLDAAMDEIAQGEGLSDEERGARVKACINTAAGASGVTVLHLAARCGWLTVVHRLLQEFGADVNARSAHRCSALMMGAEGGHLGVVQELINAGADVNAETTGFGTTALHQASRYGCEEVVSTLLVNGADPTKRLKDGRTPLYLASHAGYETILTRLIASFNALKGGDRAALKEYVDASRTEENVDRGSGKTTPLMMAANFGHRVAMQILIDSGASVNLACSDGDTALLRACTDGHEQAARMLLQAGASIDHRGAQGQSVLMTACRYGHLSLVRTLLALGAKADAVDDSGTDALSHLCEYEQDDDDEMLSLLLHAKDHPSKVDETRSSDGSAPLHIAADNQHDEATRQLLKIKADPNGTRRSDGHTPLTIASSNGYESIFGLLIDDARVLLDGKTVDGRTALHCACQHGQLKMVGRLLAAGADVAAKTSKGETPLALAKQGGTPAHQLIVATLEERVPKRRAGGKTRMSVSMGRRKSAAAAAPPPPARLAK